VGGSARPPGFAGSESPAVLTPAAGILNFRVSPVPSMISREGRLDKLKTRLAKPGQAWVSFRKGGREMEKLQAERAWAVAFDPQYLIQMGEEYDEDRLEQLNEALAKGDYALVREDTQGFHFVQFSFCRAAGPGTR